MGSCSISNQVLMAWNAPGPARYLIIGRPTTRTHFEQDVRFACDCDIGSRPSAPARHESLRGEGVSIPNGMTSNSAVASRSCQIVVGRAAASASGLGLALPTLIKVLRSVCRKGSAWPRMKSVVV